MLYAIIDIGSTYGHGIAVNNTVCPVNNLHNPIPAASFWCVNNKQNKLINAPLTIPAIAPCFVVRFQNNAQIYTGMNAAAQIPKKIVVP